MDTAVCTRVHFYTEYMSVCELAIVRRNTHAAETRREQDFFEFVDKNAVCYALYILYKKPIKYVLYVLKNNVRVQMFFSQ